VSIATPHKKFAAVKRFGNYMAQTRIDEPKVADIDIIYLMALLKPLSLKINFDFITFDWNLFASCGAPLNIKGAKTQKNPQPSKNTLIFCLRNAAIELNNNKQTEDFERKFEALQSVILALKLHNPSFYKKYCASSSLISEFLPKHYSGRIIKLKRLVLAKVSEYL